MLAGEIEPRTLVAVAVIPVDPDGLPVPEQQRAGTAELFAPERILLTTDTLPDVSALVVGVRRDRKRPQYFGMDVLARSVNPDGRVLIQGQVGGLADALLQPKNLTPRFHFDTMTFTFGFAPAVLHGWEELGVLESVVIDRLLLCPRCHGLPTFRQGCRRCGSGRVIPFALSDHNGLGQADTPVFIQQPPPPTPDNGIACRDGYLCQECHSRDVELGSVNQCLHCAHRFTAQDAYEMVLRGYRAQRFDLTTSDQPT